VAIESRNGESAVHGAVQAEPLYGNQLLRSSSWPATSITSTTTQPPHTHYHYSL